MTVKKMMKPVALNGAFSNRSLKLELCWSIMVVSKMICSTGKGRCYLLMGYGTKGRSKRAKSMEKVHST